MTVYTEQNFFLLKVFWKEIFIIIIGITIFSYGSGNINNKSSTLPITWLIVGLIIFLYGLFLMRKHSKKIRK